jgi:hypothetical protein
MKKLQTSFILSAVVIALFFTSCKKSNEGVSPGSQKHSDAKGTYITTDAVKWYLTREGSGGTVHIKLSGATNADKITITTNGDGLNSDIPISITSNGQFAEDIPVSFSAGSRATAPFQESTVLTAYKGSDTLVVTLNSGSLQY